MSAWRSNKRQQLTIVDVFAQQRYAGNPLAVVVSEDEPSDDVMQQFAAEMNFSETAFVNPRALRDGAHRVRIFTPAREIAFAGHPILGTAWVLRRHAAAGTGAAPVRLRLAQTEVTVAFERGPAGDEQLWFEAPPMALGPTCAIEPLAAALGLSMEEIDTASPAQQVSAGTSALIVPLRGLQALRRSRLDLQAFAPLAARGLPPLVYLYCRETREPGNDLSARFFFDAHGVREDPATGNGAAFLGAYLLAHGAAAEGGLSLRIEQGHEVRRPSLVLLRAAFVEGAAQVHVGGHVVPTVRGECL